MVVSDGVVSVRNRTDVNGCWNVARCRRIGAHPAGPYVALCRPALWPGDVDMANAAYIVATTDRCKCLQI
jgi:hypothetical protein